MGARRTFLISFLAVVLAACGGEQLVLHVGPERVDCIGVFEQECLLVRYRESAEWQYFYDPIQGFAFEEGYLYTLLVERKERGELVTDASSHVWRLMRTLSKVRFDGGAPVVGTR